MGTSKPGENGPDAVPGARLAEEARLLLDALAERAQPWLNRLAAGETGEGAAHTPATCGWCPVCAGMAVVRGERPELAVRAAEHAAGLLSVLRAALAEPGAYGGATAGSAAASEDSGDSSDSSGESGSSGESDSDVGRVQKITVRRKPSGDEQDR
ncbi:MAG TPA: hypothetical protein VG756_27125 [Pseudonocardiaceae bacterium]|jgi:hypothetical protein|nr:hypothetical protein [Pseudonocardiaceae bacterium]